uniref:DB domain-containing protein n=1 Tax=Parastrongyloides trichosuri TaxID=131310 RepID=A0A0N5A3C5_PARTI
MTRSLLFIVLASTLVTGQYFPQYAHQQQYYQPPPQQQFQQYQQRIQPPQQQQFQYNPIIQQKSQVFFQNQYNPSIGQQYANTFNPPQQSNIVNNFPQYQSQYPPQSYQQQFPRQLQQFQQVQYPNNVVKPSFSPQPVQYNQPNPRISYRNIPPVQVSSDNMMMRPKIGRNQYNNIPQQQQNAQYAPSVPTIQAPTYRANDVVRVVEKFPSPQYQSQTYRQEGSLDSSDAPPPPPPEKFLPEKDVAPISKTRIASETKVISTFASNKVHEKNDNIEKRVQIVEERLRQDNIQPPATSPKEEIVTPSPIIETKVVEKKIEEVIKKEKVPLPKVSQLKSHLSSSPAANAVFLKCCNKKHVSPKCESRCNFDVLSKKVLTGMFLGSDPCPQSYGRDLFSCAAQDSDHTECCRRMNVTRTTAGEKCLAFCKMTPDTEFQADVTYLPCWSVLNDIKQCFKNAIIDSL